MASEKIYRVSESDLVNMADALREAAEDPNAKYTTKSMPDAIRAVAGKYDDTELRNRITEAEQKIETIESSGFQTEAQVKDLINVALEEVENGSY